MAVGNESGGLLVTGQDLNVNDTAGNKQGEIVTGGSTDPSDSMNTSQGGTNATIGVNAQHFTDGPKVNGQNTNGPTAVFTLVDGFAPLPASGDGQATGTNVKDIDYDGYLDTDAASIFISQAVGNGTASMKISLVNASLVNGTPEEGYAGVNPYIGGDDFDVALTNDAAVAVGSVKVTRAGVDYSGATLANIGVSVVISGNSFTISGIISQDTIGFASTGGDFNRFLVQGLADTADFDIGRIDIARGAFDADGAGDNLLVHDDGPKIGPVADTLVELAVGSSAPVTLNGAVGTDPKTGPYSLLDWDGKEATDPARSINGISLYDVPNSTTGPVTSVSYFADDDGVAGPSAGDSEFYRLTLGDQAGAGNYVFSIIETPPPGKLEFRFDNLESGNFLWIGIGTEAGGLLVTGQDLNVNDTAGKLGDIVKGGSDPSDSVNTSQGGINATIGINAQHFTDGPKVNGQDTPGPVAVFTLVDGFAPLPTSGTAGQATGINVNQIDYDGYLTPSGAQLFISQTTSNASASMKITLVNASLVSGTPEEGYAGANPYIGGDEFDVALKNDAPVGVGTVTVTRAGVDYSGATLANIGVSVGISGNSFTISGITTADTIGFTAASGTFNRFLVQGLPVTADFDIGKVSLDLAQDTPDQLFNFQAGVIDGDGDTQSSNVWQVGIDGTGQFNDNIVGGVDLSSNVTSLSSTLSSTLALDSHLHDSLVGF